MNLRRKREITFQHSLEKNYSTVKQLLDKIYPPTASQVSEIIYTMNEIDHSLIFFHLGNVMLIRGINPALLKKFENFLMHFSLE